MIHAMNLPQQHAIESDIFLVHKPVGITSFDVIRKLRGITGIRKIGHAGTLDPLASGLMIVGFEKGTKKLNHYLKLPKTYIADILIGTSTTTGDLEGDVVAEKKVYKNDLKKADLEEVVIAMSGSHTLQVPLYSAIKVQGKALYQYAREGKTPPYIPEKEMNIRSIQLLDEYHSGDGHIVRVRLDVSSGTYIRTLGEEFGRRIGYPATLKSLYRVAIDTHQDQDAYRFNPHQKTNKSGDQSRFATWRAILGTLFGFFKKSNT